MEQLVQPNLNVPAQLARCLEYVEDAFNAPYSGPTANYAWEHTRFSHTDRNIPSGVYVLAWFEYWGTVDGVYDRWDHVVIYKDGTCYSSPYTNKNTHDVLSSIEEVERIYGCKFIGWSEDIGGLKIIEGAEMNTQDVTDIYQVVVGRDPVSSEYAWVGQNPMTLINALRNDANQQRATANQTIKDLEAQIDEGPSEFVEAKVYVKK